MRTKVFVVMVMVATVVMAIEGVAAAPCEPRPEYPNSSRYLPDGEDMDPDTPGVQCADHLYDMDGQRPAPPAPTAVPAQAVPAVGQPAPESPPQPAATALPAEAPTSPRPRVWWNGRFMDRDEFLCFQDAARNPFVDTLESTGCANP